MLAIDFENIFLDNREHGIGKGDFKNKDVSGFINSINKKDQGFYTCIDDEEVVEQIEEYCSSVSGDFSSIVVLGIGGSALGTICLKQSLKTVYEGGNCEANSIKLHVIDNIDPDLISQIESQIILEKTLFIVVSKSGSTVETLSQYFYFRKKIENEDLEFKKHFVFVTGKNEGILSKVANKESIKTFSIPDNVGGRFSVLTAVGLLPAKLIGLDIRALIKGAKKMRDIFLNDNFEENLCFKIAYAQYLLNNKGKTITVMMPYSQRLSRFADWYIQLLAESIGKAKNNDGETVNVGLTPVKALGVTDQHSQNQLFNEGPNDKVFMFIDVEKHQNKLQIPYEKISDFNYLEGISFNQLMRAELNGAIYSLTQNGRPNLKITVDEINEVTMGELFMLFEGAIAFLGEMFNINAFNQPGVELAKELTKKYLQQNERNS